MTDKVRTINIDGIEVQTSLTPVELAGLPQKYAELQSNWNSLREWVKTDNTVFETNFEMGRCVNFKDILDKMNELEGEDK